VTVGPRLHLGVDIGTSSCKVVAVDAEGAVVTTATRDYRLYSPRHGWSEQDPEDWWEATSACVRQVTLALPDLGDEVVAIGLSGQMHGLVALDADDRILRRAILWNDQRCEAECQAVTEAIGGLERVLSEIDNRLITGFTAGKIVWLREHEPDTFGSTRRMLNPKDFLRLRMTGQFVTEVSDASGTGLFDVANRRWSAAMLDAVGIPESMLPSVVESPDSTGRLLPAIARQWGLREDVEVYGGGGDAVVQTASMGIARPGDIGVTVGTAGVVAAVSETCPANSGNVQVSCYNAPGLWHIMGVSLSAAGALQWFTDVLNELPSSPDVGFAAIIDLARDVPAGADGLLFLPYLAGERSPHYAPAATAAMVGLTRMHGLGHMVRAVIEGALLNMREILDAFADLGIPCDRVIASGGATRDPFWLQTMADVFGIEVVTMTGSSEGGAYGAALVAGVGAGTWSSFEEVYKHLQVSSRFLPDRHTAERYNRIYAGYRNLYGHLAAVYDDIRIARGDD
jgi:xylulokinase